MSGAGALTAVLAGRYALGEPLRRTPFGRVHVGEDTRTGTPVVAEVLEPPFAADADVRRRLLAGAPALRDAVDAADAEVALVPVLDVVVEAAAPSGWTAAVVRARVGGSDVSALRAEAGGTLPPREAVAVAVEVLDALAHLHARGQVHGALVERDVLVDTSVALRPLPRLTGWGTAALVRGHAPVPGDDVRDAGRVLCRLLGGGSAAPEGLPVALADLLEALLVDGHADRPTAAQARDRLAEVPGLSRLRALPPPAATVPTAGLAALLAETPVVPPLSRPTAAVAVPAQATGLEAAVAVASWSGPADDEAPSTAARAWDLVATGTSRAGALGRRWSVTTPRGRARGVAAAALLAGLAVLVPQAVAGSDPTRTRAPVAGVVVHVLPERTRPDGLVLATTWRLTGTTLRAETVVRNPTGRTVGAGLDDVLPRSVVDDVSQLLVVPDPSGRVVESRLLRFDALLAPGEDLAWRWEADVRTGTGAAELRALARDAEVARLTYEAARRLATPRTAAVAGVAEAAGQAPPGPTAQPAPAEPAGPVVAPPPPAPRRSPAPVAVVTAAPSAPAAPTGAPTPAGTEPPTSEPPPSDEPQPSASATG